MTTIQSGAARVSVVMVVGRDLRFLGEAVDSVLRQDFRDFEFIIVDDGTGDDAAFTRLSQSDPRIRVVVNPTNLGAAAAANRGVAVSNGDIIVRLDADDIAEPTRIRCLVDALDADDDLGLVGSWCAKVDESGMPVDVIRFPESDLEIRWTILFYNPFVHSSIAYRRYCFEAAGGYQNDELISHDHYLWAAMLEVTRARNIPATLVRYRINSRGLTANDVNSRARTHQIRERSWARLGVRYDLYDDERAVDIAQFVSGGDVARADGRAAAYRTLLVLLRHFLVSEKPNARDKDREAARRLTKATVRRVIASPPKGFLSMIAICRLTWPLDRLETIGALSRHLLRKFKFHWHIL
jgi:glycosyltransferase involved in cell wall biosynthesis